MIVDIPTPESYMIVDNNTPELYDCGQQYTGII